MTQRLNYNTPSAFAKSNIVNNGIFMATVISVGQIPVNTKDKAQEARDRRFNADPYIIRCKILGSNLDNQFTDDQLPNCFPLTNKHNAIIPKAGEMVMIFITEENNPYSDRLYMGPIISSQTKLNKDTYYGGSTSGLNYSIAEVNKDLNKIPDSFGIYSEYDANYQNNIDGRDNSDIVFKSNEILLRAGKFVKGDPLTFNQVNPAYIQIRHDFKQSSIDSNGNTILSNPISVNNIVANKINLLTYNGGTNSETDNIFDLTNRDLINRKTPYITDAELDRILNEAHPMVFGDILVEYLQLLKDAFLSHNHNHFGLSVPIPENPNIDKFIKQSQKLERDMLSKNIKIN